MSGSTAAGEVGRATSKEDTEEKEKAAIKLAEAGVDILFLYTTSGKKSSDTAFLPPKPGLSLGRFSMRTACPGTWARVRPMPLPLPMKPQAYTMA